MHIPAMFLDFGLGAAPKNMAGKAVLARERKARDSGGMGVLALGKGVAVLMVCEPAERSLF